MRCCPRCGSDLGAWWAAHCSGAEPDCCAACPHDGGDGIRCDGAGGRVDVVYLHGNALTGTIPEQLADRHELTYLYLYDNVLTGPVSAGLGGHSIFFSVVGSGMDRVVVYDFLCSF